MNYPMTQTTFGHATPFHREGLYTTRCGEVAEIAGVKDGMLVGTIAKWSLRLQWHLDGRRFPAGGSDPFDLVQP